MRVALAALFLPSFLAAQGTAADYQRADDLGRRYQGLAVNIAEAPRWISSTQAVYRKSVAGGNEFVLVTAPGGQKRPAFDHARIAAALSTDSARVTAVTLPFTTFDYADDQKAITFNARGSAWRCVLDAYTCSRTGPAATGGGRGGIPVSPEEQPPYEGPSALDMEIAAEAEEVRAGVTARQAAGRLSPDGSMEAFIEGNNLAIRTVAASGRGPAVRLSTDGTASSSYVMNGIFWSPDSKKIVAYRVTPGTQRRVYYVLSSPPDQLQPRLDSTRGAGGRGAGIYRKPGDEVDLREPVLFDVTARTAKPLDRSLFPNAYTVGEFRWRGDSRAFTFEYNERGHQRYRVLEADATTGAVRPVIDEESKTFIYYNATNDGLSSGKRFRFDVADGREIIWMSERDGWNHLYLYDGATGRVKNRITTGSWVVRHVERVDTVARQVYFSGNGRNAGEDPYLLHHYRINFDGSGLVDLTPANGNHAISWSPDRRFYFDTYSRIDSPPVTELRAASTRALVMTLEQPDLSALTAAGWRAPEVFVSKARDGVTDIWGVIFRPSNYDPAKKYPVIENIYAGPQGSFVPKSFSVGNGMRTLAELGFIVVQIDGMGTSNRSKAFHDVAFRNLGDAGFADRILWHKAVAAKDPAYDISRVGIYGTSAGGQNALGGLLFQPEFYKVGFSASGCHDNRMDKIWWNEQWMSWPIGAHYAASSNTEHAAKLQGKLLLVIPEHDTNVDPSSSMQVVNALIRANKHFDLLYVPNADHGSGGAYGERKRNDFFVHNLIGIEGPDRNRPAALQAGRPGGSR